MPLQHKCCGLIGCRWLITHANLFVAWMFNVLYSSALVYLSTWTVVNIAPQAGGAGVAEVTAYLNGCNLPKVRALVCCHYVVSLG